MRKSRSSAKVSNSFWKELERFVDWVMPIVLLMVLAIVVLDVFYPEVAVAHDETIYYFDWFIFLAFFTDLAFKFRKVPHLPTFARRYWLDILATLPLFVVIRFLEIGRAARLVQGTYHVGIDVPYVAQELGERGRYMIEIASRLPRFLKLVPMMQKVAHLYESPAKRRSK